MIQTAFTVPASSASKSATAGRPGCALRFSGATPQCAAIASRSAVSVTLR
jgi:hypothetical protein